MASNFSTIRLQINRLQKEIRAFEGAITTMEEAEAQLRQYLATTAQAHNRLIEYAAFALNGGGMADLFPTLPQLRVDHALGLAINTIGIDAIVEQAKARAATEDTGALRLPEDEKEAKLLDLRRSLYALELSEEAALNGNEPRRAGVTPAAVLGIPADVAEEFGLLSRKA